MPEYLQYESSEEIMQMIEGLNALTIIIPTNYDAERERMIAEAIEKGGHFSEPHFEYDEKKMATIAARRPGFYETREPLRVYRDLRKSSFPEGNDLKSWIIDLAWERLAYTDNSIFGRAEFLNNLIENGKAAVPFINFGSFNRFSEGEGALPSNEELREITGKSRYWESGAFGQNAKHLTIDELEALKSRRFNAGEIRNVFQQALNANNIIGWTVEVSSDVSSITVIGEWREILIPPKRNVKGTEMAKLIAHEIEGHVRGRCNAESMMISLLNEEYGNSNKCPLYPFVPLLSKSPNELINEGAAKIAEVDLIGEKSLPTPFYCVALYYAIQRKYSFVETLRAIFDIRSASSKKPENAASTAWLSAYRVFRGGGMSKDKSYYLGYKKLRSIEALNPVAFKRYVDYATLSDSEIDALMKFGVDFDRPPYPQKHFAAEWARKCAHGQI